jgi:hypothetical protein
MSCENISKEELLQDIKNTELELSAYKSLQEAFLVLSEITENQGINQERYIGEYSKYLRLQRECSEFLEELYEFKVEREIDG